MSVDIFNDNYFMYTTAAWVITATNGSLSAASSMLIMSVIFRSSPEARYSAYHMIMFFMSFWDTMSSIAFAFHTIPMPRDVYDIYPYAGKALGSVTTCEVQGFFIIMGSLFVFGSNMTLNLYYVCTFRYAMAEKKFKRCIMTTMFVLYTVVSVSIATYVLKMDLVNPSPFGLYCIAESYPFGCGDSDSPSDSESDLESSTTAECIRGDEPDEDDSSRSSNLQFVYMIGNAIILGTFVILVMSLMLVVVTVFEAELGIRRNTRRTQQVRRQQQQQQQQQQTNNNLTRSLAREIERFRRTRTILIQALMYIVAFFITWAWVFNLTSRMHSYSQENGGPSNITLFLVVFFQPLQGFFNAMIFMYQKVHTLRLSRNHRRRLSFFAAFKQVIVSPHTVPEVVVSSIEIATEDIEVRRVDGDGDGDVDGVIHGHGVQQQARQRQHQLLPGQLTNEEREEIAEISGMRRVGYNARLNEITPPPSISSGAGSSFISGGEISIGNLNLSSFYDEDDDNDNTDNDDNDEEDGNRNESNAGGDHEYEYENDNQNMSAREDADSDANISITSSS